MLKPYEEMRKVDVTPYCEERDGIKYLNWARCIDLLYKHGAEKVRFVQNTTQSGSSLFTAPYEFIDKNKQINRCYEVCITLGVDNNEWTLRHPLVSGTTPVKDSWLTAQQVWNAQARALVKCAAINTGLGFDLWVRNEMEEAKNTPREEDLSVHSLKAIKHRLQELVTTKMNVGGLSLDEIAQAAGFADAESFRGIFSYFSILDKAERTIAAL